MIFQNPQRLPSCICWPYIGFGAVLAGLFVDRFLRNERSLHEARLEDRSVVEALIVQARNVTPRLPDSEKPDNYEQKMLQLSKEVDNLEALGPEGWTEFQILSLDQMLVEFLKLDDLKAISDSSLGDLEDYAGDSTHPYDIKLFSRWEGRINTARDKIDKASDILKKDAAAESLRAELRSLLEHVAYYEKSWAHGSTVVRNLMICGIIAVPIVLLMGILPAFYPVGNKALNIFNWGFLGISGSITSVLLYLYRTNRVEVGNTEGMSALRRAVLGATLGLVAGVLIYSLIVGGVVSAGYLIPNPVSSKLADVSLSILVAFASGFSFERLFDRMRQVMETES